MIRIPQDLYPRVETFAQSQFISIPAIILQSLLKKLEEFENGKLKIDYKMAKMTGAINPPAGKKDTRKAKIEAMEAMTDEEITKHLISMGFIEAPHINNTGRMEKKYIYSMSEDRIAKEGDKIYNPDGTYYYAAGGEMLLGRTRMLAQHIYLESDPEHDYSKCDLMTWSEVKNKLIEKKLI